MTTDNMLSRGWTMTPDPDEDTIVVKDDGGNFITAISTDGEHYSLSWNESIVALRSLDETYTWILEHYLPPVVEVPEEPDPP